MIKGTPGVWYATVEDVLRVLRGTATPETVAVIGEILEHSSRSIELDAARVFHPQYGTRYKDWPARTQEALVLHLGDDELISLESVTSGGVVISADDRFLRPDTGPPYNRIEIDRASAAAFAALATPQRSVALLGWFGFNDDAQLVGLTTGSLTSSATTVTVDYAHKVGIGDLIKIGTERMIVTDRTWSDTGVTTGVALASDDAVVSIPVGSATAFMAGEQIMVDAERMNVLAMTGTTAVVERATAGTTLAAHTITTPIYAPRSLTVERGAVGTTATTHNAGAITTRYRAPGPVRMFVRANTLGTLMQEHAAYARQLGTGENVREVAGRGLAQARKQIEALYRHRVRARAV